MASTGHFDQIDHKFLISGHSSSASDRDFALIEKQGNRAKMKLVEDVIQVIQEARPSKPFKVLDVGESHCFNFNSLASAMLNTTKVKISELSWLHITKEDVSKVFCKQNFNSMESFKGINILRPGYTRRDFLSLELESVPNWISLNENKEKDLRSMLPYIDPMNRPFFENILRHD